MDRPPREALIGRDDALARITRAVASTRHHARGTLLVSGAAGMGKTALLRTALAGVGDVVQAWGTCVEAGNAPGYWPWTQALNGLVRGVGIDRARAAAAGDRGLLATISTALGEQGPAEQSDRGRLLLLDATAAWLDALAAVRPVVVVLDDLQWLDDSSLALLERVVQDPRPAALCLLGAFRHDEVPRPLQARLTALVARAQHVHLTGLDRSSAALLVQGTVGRPVPEETTAVIYRRAGGHPLFTRELALAGADGLPEAEVPAAVREVIGRRLRTLPAETQEVLRVAALTGSTVLPDVVAVVTGRTPAAVQDAAVEAVPAGMLLWQAGRLRFAHDLFRESIADGVDAAARPALHLAIGSALESRAARGGDVAASELARHFRAALSCGGLDHAVSWALRAAEVDRSALALTEAAMQLRRLRGAVADAGLALPEDRLVDVLLTEADVLARSGRPSDARGLVRAARTAADQAGDAVRTTRAALAAAALGSRFATRRDDLVAELESALASVGDADPALEARLTAALARELQHSVPEQRSRAGPLSERALRLGRATEDPEVMTACLLARHDVLWTPSESGRRAEVTSELVALTQRSGDRERQAEALLLQATALLEAGSAAFEPALEACLELLTALGQPRHLYIVETRRACLALMRGHLEEATVRIEDAAALGDRLREPDTGNVHMSQRLELIRARGVPEELTDFARAAVGHWTGAPVHAHAVAAGFCARGGDLDGARHHVAAVHDLGSWRADRSYLWSVFVRELSYAAAALGDVELCTELLEEVRPLAGGCGTNGAFVAFAGCHAHTAGRLAAAVGDDSLARTLLEEACSAYERLGAAALAQAREDMAACAAPSGRTASLIRRGPVWEVAFAGRTAAVGHCKGLQDIAILLRHPRREVHVLDLVASPAQSDSVGEVVDRTGLDHYRSRLAELSDERLQAGEDGDAARLRAVDEEHESLVAELQRVTGLGGRPRTFANRAVERARKAVTERIRDAVRRLDDVLPEAGAHLDRYVVTGVRCRYLGDQHWDVNC